MARVSMWQLEGYPVTKLTRVDWDGMTMDWESGGPNLFYLSASVVFAFGGPRDATALMHDLARLGKIERRADLVRLLGLGRHGHSTVYRWMTVRDRRPGPIMTCRVLVMTLWASFGVTLADIWSVDWESELVEWRYGVPKPHPNLEPFGFLQGGDPTRTAVRSTLRWGRNQWGVSTVGVRPGSPYQSDRPMVVVGVLPSPTKAPPVFPDLTVALTESPPAPR